MLLKIDNSTTCPQNWERSKLKLKLYLLFYDNRTVAETVSAYAYLSNMASK